MKQLLPLVFFTALTFSAFSQNYQLIKSNEQRLYTAAVGHVGLEVAEATFDGDSVFRFAPHWIGFQDDWACAYADSSSMLGRKVRIAADGTTVLYTAHDETITLHTQANAGDDPWLSYTAGDGTWYFEAFVSETTQEDILGTADSVKTFSFQSFNADGTPAEHWVENHQIRIGENSGLVFSPQWAAFPGHSGYPAVEGHLELSGFEGAEGVQNIKWFDVYDFDVDDEIHIEKVVSNYGEGTVEHLLNRYLARQDYPDSIVYEVEVKRWFYQGNMQEINMEYQGTTIESHTVQGNPSFDALPATPVILDYEDGWDNFGSYYQIDTYEDFPAKYLPRGDYMYTENVEGAPGCYIEMIDWGCWSGDHAYFVKGLGGPYSYCSSGAPSYNYTSLMYSNKSGEEWGSPLSTTASERLSANALKAYPNPAADHFMLGMQQDHYPLNVSIYDISGRLLGNHILQGPEDAVSVEGLPPGMLILQARLRDGSVAFGKVTVR